ncbi:MAG: dihydrolipoamide acetyltransferase family protein [Nesterenkonia sp.]
MSQIFTLPDVGEGLTEADIVSWRVAVGDTVAVNDIICEIETAKSLVELPVPYAGTVDELVAAEGETVEVGQPLIRIGGAETPDDDAAAPAADEASAQAGPAQKEPTETTPTSTEPAKQQPQAGAEEENQALVGSGPKADSAKHRRRLRSTAPDLVDVSDLGIEDHGRPQPERSGAGAAESIANASPPVRALAKRLGVAAAELVGSGRGGQVTRDDVERQARQKQELRESGKTSETGAPAPGASQGLSEPAGLLRAGPREENVQVRGVRKATALNVSASASSVPHVSVFKEIDVSATMNLRRVLKNDSAYQDLSVSPTLFAAKAIIWAARRNPQVNASWHEDHYTLHNYVNLGIAAATPRGLVVPVIHDAHIYNTPGLAAALTQLTADARQGRTTAAEMQGGTVSITNVGSLGLDTGTPILPPGQAAIIALGAVRRKPWVVDGQVVPRDVMVVGGSFDHRLIDGDLAGAFISDVAAVMEQPGLLID